MMFKKLAAFFERFVDPYPPNNFPANSPKKLHTFIWMCTDGLRKYISAMILCSMLAGTVEALIFSLLGRLVDRLGYIQPAQLWEESSRLLILLAALLIFSPFTVGVQTLFKFQTLQGNFPMRLRWNFHRQMLNQSMHFFQEEFSGAMATKVLQTALAVRDIVVALSDILVFVGVYFTSAALVLWSFDLHLLLPFSIWLILYLSACIYFLPRLTRVAKEQAAARSLIAGRISDAYTNIATVKLFSHTRREGEYVRDAMKAFMIPVYSQQRLVSGFDFGTYTLSMGLVLSTAAMALWLWTQGKVGVGIIATSTAMALRFNSVSQWAMWVVADLFEHIGTAQDGMNMLSRPCQLTDSPNASRLKVKSGEILFDRVAFSYKTDRYVLKDFNLSLSAGEKVGLVGRSGAGKSTIINLLLRFYDIEDGRILIDGQDIRQVTQESLRSQIGMVTQDTSLLHRSIRDNIVYGHPNASDTDMRSAAIRAQADAFIQTLTDASGRRGYDAHVGERGVKLSGGQRQRISIARVILKNAPILLLDEATSALDSEIEAAIQSSLYALMEGKTVLAIAHRLSTVAAMDRLIILDQGYIVETGSHTELLRSGGLYSQLWHHQSGGFLGEA